MARIKSARTPGEPAQRMIRVRPWGRKAAVSRPKLGIRRLVKANPADALGLGGMDTVSRDNTTGQMIPAGTGRATAPVRKIVSKAANLTTRQAKGTKTVKAPSPTNRGGVRRP